MVFNFDKLKGRIVEKFSTRTAFAEAAGLSKGQLHCRLNNKTTFRSEEVLVISELLEIPADQIGTYFFTVKVR